MIRHNAFEVDPWSVTERSLDLGLLAQTESIFALANGHIGLRGNLDEGEPHAFPGSYLNGFFETLPMPYAEGGYGYPEEGQTLINVTNAKLIRLLVDDEPTSRTVSPDAGGRNCARLSASSSSAVFPWWRGK